MKHPELNAYPSWWFQPRKKARWLRPHPLWDEYPQCEGYCYVKEGAFTAGCNNQPEEWKHWMKDTKPPKGVAQK